MSDLTKAPNSLEARDIAAHLHPYTNQRKAEAEGSLMIDRGEGIYVFDTSGKRYIEAMAGLWSVAVGFNEERLVEAAANQMRKLPYYHTFTQKGHEPSVLLAEKLLELAPVKMSKVHFTNSGSEANDTAMKMVWYRSNALGQPQRKKIISRLKGYHGVTIASASLTGLPNNHRSFDLPLPQVLHTACPNYTAFAAEGESVADFVARLAKELEDLILAEGPDTIAAFIGEPVMGAGGVIIPPEGYWAAIQAVLKKYDILLIADEVICGFGRTGEMFGSTTFGMEPDILVCSKQLSSSYMPISAILVNDRVYQPLADESAKIGTFGHGFTAAGHPVTSAVALENLKIIEERDLVGNVKALAPVFAAGIAKLARHADALEGRSVGLIGCLEMKPLDGAAPGARGAKLVGLLQQEGVIARAIGDTIALCPPLVITEAQLAELFAAFEAALAQL